MEIPAELQVGVKVGFWHHGDEPVGAFHPACCSLVNGVSCVA